MLIWGRLPTPNAYFPGSCWSKFTYLCSASFAVPESQVSQLDKHTFEKCHHWGSIPSYYMDKKWAIFHPLSKIWRLRCMHMHTGMLWWKQNSAFAGKKVLIAREITKFTLGWALHDYTQALMLILSWLASENKLNPSWSRHMLHRSSDDYYLILFTGFIQQIEAAN